MPEMNINDSKVRPLIVILGPTAVGKTEISIQLAKRLNGEIVSADSRLFYRGMDIGTAKPSCQDREEIPHHLIDVADPDEIWSLAQYQKRAMSAIDNILKNGRIPFLVGGSGQYIRSIVEGWVIPKVPPDEGLRRALEAWALEVGEDGLHNRLAVLDPVAAANIDQRNLRRTIRALEVILRTGDKFSAQRLRGRGQYHSLQLGLIRPRSELYKRIDSRIEIMLENGFENEVRGLLDRGYSPDLPTMSAIGYREMTEYIQGKVSLDEALTLMKRSSRIFVRRQANWFKENDPDIRWFRVTANIVDEMEQTIRKFLFVNSNPSI